MGRGRSKAGGSTSLYKGLYIEGSAGQYQRQADEIVKGTKDVLKDFGLENEIRGVYFSPKGVLIGGEAEASMNGMGDLHISTNYLARGNEDTEGYHVSDTFYGTGAHEAGHAVVNGLLKNVDINPDDTNKSTGRANLERATARSKGKLEKEIIKEAKKRYGSNPTISGYGSKNVKEKVAEAISDVYTNKSKANPYSKTIVGVMKDIKKGKFNPTITVTKRQMGI
jgi:hypothetical protein